MPQFQIAALNPSRDYPRLRAYSHCPLCGHPKGNGLLCCWPCFNLHGVGGGRYSSGNIWAESLFGRAEANLGTTAMFDQQYPNHAYPVATHKG